MLTTVVEIAGLEPAASSTPRKRSAKTELYLDKIGIGFSHSGAPISFSQPFSLVSLTNCGLMRRVIHKPAAASRAVSSALSIALLRKYWVFNLFTRSDGTYSNICEAGGQGGCRAHYLKKNGFTVRRVCRFATYPNQCG